MLGKVDSIHYIQYICIYGQENLVFFAFVCIINQDMGTCGMWITASLNAWNLSQACVDAWESLNMCISTPNA